MNNRPIRTKHDMDYETFKRSLQDKIQSYVSRPINFIDTVSTRINETQEALALVHVNNGYPRIQYVFDVSDIGTKNNSCNLVLWQYREEYRDVVTKALEERFGIPCDNGFPDQLEDIAAKLAKDYWDDYHSQIMYELAGSTL